MKKILASIFALALSVGVMQAQNDTMYIMKAGSIIGSYKVTGVDSVIFYKPTSSVVLTPLTFVDIPAGTFTMGSPSGEANRITNEVEHQVTLSAFRMSKYEITNAQYAAFLNAKSIGSNGKYAAGADSTQSLIFANNWGLVYTNNQWEPLAGYANNPVIYVTWLGATEFATYIGGTLPTEAQWEYACRGGSTTAFNTGACLSDAQANYNWANPQTGCANTNTTSPGKTQAVGLYPANAFGLHDMHGNVFEWCSDWQGDYTTTAQTNPTGAATGNWRIFRGGSWNLNAPVCRSAYRNYNSPSDFATYLGFRVVLVP